MQLDGFKMGRRGLMLAGASWLAHSVLGRSALSDDRPPVTRPRATSGDDRSEPKWDEALTITVGPKDADLVGSNEKVLQAAVDYVARLGGGTVKVLPGTYRLRNSVYLKSNIRIVGSGLDSVLLKEPSIKSKTSEDSDWYDQEITLAGASGFAVGDGICLRTKNPHNGGINVAKRTLIARSGSRFKLDRALRENFWLMGDTTVSTLFPILSGDEVQNIAIENITLDGNRSKNENLDGNYAGCVFLQDCRRITMRDVTARNYNGDGLSWQICHDVIVERCHSHGHAGLGLHPGSGSQRPLMRENKLEGNDIGIFFCWGVKFGLAEKNVAIGNRVGVSIGHRDTDNLVRDNDIKDSGQVGVLFRPERGPGFAPHRTRLEGNRIVNSGGEHGIGVDVQSGVESVTIARNEIQETRDPMKRIGVRVGAETRDVTLVGNRINGFAQDVVELKKA